MRVCYGCAGHGKGLQAGTGIRSAGSNPARFPAEERVGDHGCRCKSRLRNTNRQRFQRRDFADRKLFRTFADVFPAEGCARMVESVDTPDLKSCGQQWPCRFDPGSGYQEKSQMTSTVVWDSCFWYAAAVQEPGLVPPQTGDQRQSQSNTPRADGPVAVRQVCGHRRLIHKTGHGMPRRPQLRQSMCRASMKRLIVSGLPVCLPSSSLILHVSL